MKAIYRTIAHAETHYNRGYEKHWAVGGRIRITLDGCGHEQSRKLSQGLPARVRCKECEGIRGGRRMRTKIGDGPWKAQIWNAETGLPETVEVEDDD